MDGVLSQAFSRYAVSFRLEDLPLADRAHLIDAFVNWVGCALGGSRASAVGIAARAYLWISPHGTHRALGRPELFDLTHAVSLDCQSSSVLAFDDTHLETVLHPTGPIAAAVLGLARTQPISGRDFLAALHVGMEVECRAGLAIASAGTGSPRGWYVTGLVGGIGAAVAIGRVLGFDESRMQNAIGIAAARASGTRGTHGSMTATYVPAIAAESGLIAAKLAETGLTCGAQAFDGKNGLLQLVTERPGTERALRNLGSVSEAARTAFKPYPCGIVAHPVIDACFELMRRHGVTAKGLISLRFRISQTALDLVANRLPKDQIEAQTSLYYWAAAALQTGSAGIEQTAPGLTADPSIRALQEIMSVELDGKLANDQCAAIAVCDDGVAREVFIEHASGSTDLPMTSADIDKKFLSLAAMAMSHDRAARTHEACRGVLELPGVSSILEF